MKGTFDVRTAAGANGQFGGARAARHAVFARKSHHGYEGIETDLALEPALHVVLHDELRLQCGLLREEGVEALP